MPTLEQILRTLERFHQRTTYGAVGAVVGIPARSLMSGLSKDPLHSWVVRKSNGQPTGYLEVEKHPSLTARSAVLSRGDELAAWLRAPR